VKANNSEIRRSRQTVALTMVTAIQGHGRRVNQANRDIPAAYHEACNKSSVLRTNTTHGRLFLYAFNTFDIEIQPSKPVHAYFYYFPGSWKHTTPIKEG